MIFKRTYRVSVRSGGTVSEDAIRAFQDSALRQAGWREGFPVIRSVRTRPDGTMVNKAETEIPIWLTWRARVVRRYRPRCFALYAEWLAFKGRFA